MRHHGTVRERLSRQLLEDQLAHPAGVGLAAHLLHHRADERAGGGDLAVADLLRHVGVGLDGAVDGRRPARRRRRRPRGRAPTTTSSGVPSPASTPSNTCRASLSLTRPASISAWMPATCSGVIVEGVEVDILLVGAPGQLAEPPLAGGLRGGAGVDGVGDQVERTGADGVAHVEVAEAPVVLQASAPDRRRLGQRGPQLLDPLARRRDGSEVGLGEVAVVVGVGLLPAGRRAAVALVEVPGLLHDLLAGVEERRVPADLVAGGPLDRAERVDVLGLRAGAELVTAERLEGQVDVAAQRALVHPDVGDAEAADEVAQVRRRRRARPPAAFSPGTSMVLVTISMSGMPARL